MKENQLISISSPAQIIAQRPPFKKKLVTKGTILLLYNPKSAIQIKLVNTILNTPSVAPLGISWPIALEL